MIGLIYDLVITTHEQEEANTSFFCLPLLTTKSLFPPRSRAYNFCICCDVDKDFAISRRQGIRDCRKLWKV